MPPWSTSDRREHLPRNWQTIRLAALRRDGYLCRIHGPGCTLIATEVDHISGRDDHRPENLQAVCHKCHAAKSSSEGRAALDQVRARGRRPTERHPGLTE